MTFIENESYIEERNDRLPVIDDALEFSVKPSEIFTLEVE